MILLVGYGYWGKNLARNFKNELYAICEQDDNRCKEALELYPDIKIYKDISNALLDSHISAVVVATKANTHFEVAKKCLEYKKHLWIEKPVCENTEEINELIKLSEYYCKTIFIDHTFCYNTAVQYIKKYNIGTPVYYNSSRVSLGLFQADVDVVLDLAIHDASIINYLYPDLILEDKQIIKNYHVNDIANQCIINLKFTNNFTASINCNWVSPVKQREIVIAGSDKSIVYNDMREDKIKIYETGIINESYNADQLGDMISPKIDNYESLYVARTHFLDCIKNNKLPVTNIYQARKIMDWLL